MTSMEEHFVHKDDNFIEFLLSSLSNHLIKSLNFIKFIKCRDHIYYLIYYSTYYFSFIVNDKFKSSYYVLQCQIVWVFEVVNAFFHPFSVLLVKCIFFSFPNIWDDGEKTFLSVFFPWKCINLLHPDFHEKR